MTLTCEDRREIEQLSARYASLADGRAFAEMGELFTADAVLVPPGGRLRGRDAIVAAMHGLSRYDRTFHLVGQVRQWADGEAVRGETYCVAHHFTATPDGTRDRVMYIRYQDEYAHDGVWRFARRELDVAWSGPEDERATP